MATKPSVEEWRVAQSLWAHGLPAPVAHWLAELDARLHSLDVRVRTLERETGELFGRVRTLERETGELFGVYLESTAATIAAAGRSLPGSEPGLQTDVQCSDASKSAESLERVTGIEPATFSLGSTPPPAESDECVGNTREAEGAEGAKGDEA
jgi:hypothetical protein